MWDRSPAWVADATAILQAVADPTARDSSGSAVSVPDYLAALEREARGLRVGVPRSHFYEDLDPEVAAAVAQALEVIQSLVASLREISLAAESKRELQSYEAYLYHSQFLGDWSDLYQPETLRRILAGRTTEWAGYTSSILELRESRRRIASLFADVDLLVTPTVPVPAPPISAFRERPEAQRPRELLLLRNTQPFNVWGLPAISLPCGFTRSGLPIGLQIAGPHWGETDILRLAHRYEEATNWHRRQDGSSRSLHSPR